MYGYGYSPFIKSASSSGGTPVDPDAQAFITSAAITNPTQQTAINQLVTDLKGYGVWSKLRACYPFIGGTASSHKFNLKNPLDTDAAFRLVFNGGWRHSANGALPNGVNGFANTYFNPVTQSLSYNNNHLSYYSRTSAASVNSIYEIGSGNGSAGGTALFTNRTSSTQSAYDTGTAVSNRIAFTNTNGSGFFVGSSVGTRGIITRNGVQQNFKDPLTVVSMESYNYYLGGFNEQNTVTYYSNKQVAFASIGDGLTDTEAANFYTAVQTFQVTLGRSIGTQTVSDADAQAFVTNAGIVDQVEADAVNNLVIGLKADGLWSKMKAVYPFVGSSASSHKYNLRNPLDTDAAFRLVFNGGWSHSNVGIIPNSINTFADTFLTPNTALSVHNYSFSAYSRTNASDGNKSVMGSGTGYTPMMALKIFNPTAFEAPNFGASAPSYTETTGLGFFTAVRTAINNAKVYRNGVLKVTNTTSATSTNLPTFKTIIGAFNQGGTIESYSNKQLAFASIGDGLTDTEAANFYTRVQAFNTTLNRQV